MKPGNDIRRVDAEWHFALSVNPIVPRGTRSTADGGRNKVDNNTEPRIFSASCKSSSKSAPSFDPPVAGIHYYQR